VVVLSDTARCLKMRKGKFDEIIAECKKVMAANKDIIIQGAVNQLSFFRSLSNANKKRIIEAMTVATYPINSYICREGAPGHSFFILTDGECKVTVNNEDGTEREVSRLYPGEFFGMFPLVCLILTRYNHE
jgi:signal-transduction protein with cAMP-binding, CBS, and nucleotidyltransferase domain